MEFSIEKKVSQHLLCGGKYTSKPPFCDGCQVFPHDGQDEWIEEHPQDVYKAHEAL